MIAISEIERVIAELEEKQMYYQAFLNNNEEAVRKGHTSHAPFVRQNRAHVAAFKYSITKLKELIPSEPNNPSK